MNASSKRARPRLAAPLGFCTARMNMPIIVYSVRGQGLWNCATKGRKMHKHFGVLFVLFCGFCSVLGASHANVRVSVRTPGQITVEAELSSPMRSWSFRNRSEEHT